ncbi:hypothetical protein [Brucella cytisi]|uniref:hypothetical protein n=2 Tax=Brucella cytisi TaxID=407152 RepID=UPI00313EDE29
MFDKEILAAERARLTQDVDELRRQLAQLKLEQSALLAFIDRAHRRNILVVGFVSVATAIGWALDASEWLRWYLLAFTLLLCGVFTFGASGLERFRFSLNRMRFPNQFCSDSLMLAGWRPALDDRTDIE